MSALEPLHVVYLLVILYALCYQLQSPLEPFLVDSLSAKDADGAAAYARLQSFFSVVQMVGSFMVGYLLDVFGIRVMFALNFIGCAMSYGLLAHATTLDGLYLSKMPAVLMAGFLCAQTAAAKLTPAGAERATALGRLTSAYTVGGVIGPALGGAIGVQAAARLAVAGSLLAVCLVLLLPSTVEAALQPTTGGGAADAPRTAGSHAKRGAGPTVVAPPKAAAPLDDDAPSFFGRVHSILLLTWPLVLTKMASGVVNSSMGAARPLLLKNEFQFDAARLGIFMSASFFGSACVGLRLGAITSYLGGNRQTIIKCLSMMACGYAAMAAAFEPLVAGVGRLTPHNGVWLYASLSLALALFQFPLATTITALTTGAVPANLKGMQVGIEHTTFAFASLLGPSIGVAVLETFGLAGCALASSTAYGLLFLSWRARGEAMLPSDDGSISDSLGAPLLPKSGARGAAGAEEDEGEGWRAEGTAAGLNQRKSRSRPGSPASSKRPARA